MLIFIAFVVGLIAGGIGGFNFCIYSLAYAEKKGEIQIKL